MPNPRGQARKHVANSAGSIASAGSQSSATTPTPTQPTFTAARVSLPHTPANPGRPPSQAPAPCPQRTQKSGTLGIPASAFARNGSIWNKNGGAISLFKQAATRQGLSVAQSITPSEVALQLNSFTIDDDTAVANPSEAPTPADMSGIRGVPVASTIQGSTMSATEKTAKTYAKKSLYKRYHFKKGHIISLPYHTSNTNPKVDPNDRRLAETVEGYVYSKRRMQVVLWAYKQDLFCVPLYSFDGKGIQGKPEHLRHEYVSVRNAQDQDFVNQGVHRPIAAEAYGKPFTSMTAVHITGGKMVGCNEDIAFCGKLTKQSYTQLMGLYNTLSQAAQRETLID